MILSRMVRFRCHLICEWRKLQTQVLHNKFWLVNFRARPVLRTVKYTARRQSHLAPEATCSLNLTDTVVTFTDCFKCSIYLPFTILHQVFHERLHVSPHNTALYRMYSLTVVELQVLSDSVPSCIKMTYRKTGCEDVEWVGWN